MTDATSLTGWVATAARRTTVGPVTIWNADARELARYITEPVDLVITSPPYNVGIPYNSHDDMMSVGDYRNLLSEVFIACYNVMAPGARLCVVVPAGVGRNPYLPLAGNVAAIMAGVIGLSQQAEIIWDKGKPVAASRTSWGSWRSSAAPCIRDRTERILVAKKSGVLPIPPLPDGWLSAELFTELTQDLWEVRPESARRVGHPTPFPVKLVENLVRLYGFPGCHVLDPFAGSGTVGVAALALGCRATLFDIDAVYCDLAARRCEVARPHAAKTAIDSQ